MIKKHLPQLFLSFFKNQCSLVSSNTCFTKKSILKHNFSSLFKKNFDVSNQNKDQSQNSSNDQKIIWRKGFKNLQNKKIKILDTLREDEKVGTAIQKILKYAKKKDQLRIQRTQNKKIILNKKHQQISNFSSQNNKLKDKQLNLKNQKEQEQYSGFQDNSKSYNVLQQKKQNLKNGYLPSQSLRSNILRCDNVQFFIWIFNEYKSFFNLRIQSIAINKFTSLFLTQIENKRAQKQIKKLCQGLSPFIQYVLSLYWIKHHNIQMNSQEIKVFLYFNRKLKNHLLQYFPQFKLKLQNFKKYLVKRITQILDQFEFSELINIHYDLIKQDIKLQSIDIYNQMLQKKQSYVFNYFSFNQFVYLFTFLQQVSTNVTPALLKKRIEIFQFFMNKAMSQDGLPKIEKNLEINYFASYFKHLICYSQIPKFLLKNQLGYKLFEHLINVVYDDSISRGKILIRQSKLIKLFKKDLEFFTKFAFLFQFLIFTSNSQKINQQQKTIDKLQQINRKVLKKLQKQQKDTLKTILNSYSNVIQSQKLIQPKKFQLFLQKFIQIIS